MIASLILSLALLPAQQPTTQKGVFVWDYSTAEISTGQVNRFEIQINDGPWVDVGRTASADQSEATEGVVTYEAPIPALTLGHHTAKVRACNPVECGPETALGFVISITPVQVPRFGVKK